MGFNNATDLRYDRALGALMQVSCILGRSNEAMTPPPSLPKRPPLLLRGIFSEGGVGQSTHEIENNVVLNSKYIDYRFVNGSTKLRMLRDNYKCILNSPGDTWLDPCL